MDIEQEREGQGQGRQGEPLRCAGLPRCSTWRGEGSNLTSVSDYSSKYVSALGLDVGRKRIGVAGCDRLGLIATGITTVERTSFQQDVEQIQKLIKEREVEVLVVGLPYSMDGSLGFQAKQVQKFATRLSKALHLPVEYIDERLTSFQAEQLLLAENRSPSRHKALIDRKAAALILQQWLDTRRTSLQLTE